MLKCTHKQGKIQQVNSQEMVPGNLLSVLIQIQGSYSVEDVFL